MNEPPKPPDPPEQRARRSSALPWILLAVGLCLIAGVGVALVVLLAPRPPEIVVPGPVVTVRIGWVDASPEEVELNLSIPVEERLAGVAGTVSIRTEARMGECVVKVEFASGTSESAALKSVRRVLEGVILPEDADRPEVAILAGPGDRTVYLALSGDVSLVEILRGAGAVRERLSRDPGVRRAETLGAPREIILVQVGEHRLEQFGVSPDALCSAVRDEIRKEPEGEPAPPGEAGTVLGQLVILMHGEIPVYLRDLAEVRRSLASSASEAWDESGPVVLIRAVCRAGADASLMQGDVAGLEKDLPPGVRVQARWADESDKHLLFLHWRAPAGEAVPALREIAPKLSGQEEVTEMIAWRSPHEDCRAMLRTGLPARDVAPNLVDLLTRLPGIVLLNHPDPARQPLTFDVHLEDGQAPAELVEDLRNMLRSMDGVEFVAPGPAPATRELNLVVDQQKAVALGIAPASVTAQIAFFATGREVGTVGGVPVVVRIGEPPRWPDDLDGLRVRSPSGQWVPLKALASFELSVPSAAIRRVSGRRVVTFSLVPSEGEDREKILANARNAVRRRMQEGD